MNYGELKSNAIPGCLQKVVVLPIGSLEQHGHHLPMLTDTLIGSEIVRRCQEIFGDEVLFLPYMWLGASDHHLDMPGTISASNDTYTSLLIDILESLIHHGFRKIVILNSHGGNGGPGGNAVYQVNLRHQDKPDLWIVFTSWFGIAGPQITGIEVLEQKHVTHACELETSMILYLRPDLVNMGAAKGANIAFKSDFWSADSSGHSRVQVGRSFKQTTLTGALGHPEYATAEKGARLYEVATQEVAAFIREFISWENFSPE